MNERTLTEACMMTLRQKLPQCELLKHADRWTAGVPDLTCSWKNATTWLEFKYLRGHETVHDLLEPLQLETCIRLERQTQRCWVIAWHRKETLIYRPTRLVHGLLPLSGREANAGCLWETGVIQSVGFGHELVARIIEQTHL